MENKQNKPCKECPWTKKGMPDIKKEQTDALANGGWFCCHVNMGTCFGAENLKIKNSKKNLVVK